MATNVNELELPTFDPSSFADRAEGRRLLAEARQCHWLARSPLGYFVTHYDDVVAMLRDRRLHQLARILAELNGVTDERFLARRRTSILTAEGDEHTRLRRLVAPAFTPKSADRFRPFMRTVIAGLVDEISPRGRCDLVAEVCEPYPIPIICELLGAPKEDWKLFSRWAADVLRVFNGNLNEDLPVIMQAQDELDEYVRDLIEVRRQQPGDDLLTDLIAAEEAGDRLSTDELAMLAEAVLIAGTDTTRNQLGLAVAMFAGHQDQWALLAERPELAPRAVEESMRVLGAVRNTGRIVTEDVVYRDVLFPAGTLVFPGLAAGNLDPSTFAEPERFDITRQGGSAQLTFGSGIHVCLGAALARAELQEALPLLARRMPELRLDGEIAWKPNTVGIWGPERLPIAFTPGH
jgi:cytochrome P450